MSYVLLYTSLSTVTTIWRSVKRIVCISDYVSLLFFVILFRSSIGVVLLDSHVLFCYITIIPMGTWEGPDVLENQVFLFNFWLLWHTNINLSCKSNYKVLGEKHSNISYFLSTGDSLNSATKPLGDKTCQRQRFKITPLVNHSNVKNRSS